MVEQDESEVNGEAFQCPACPQCGEAAGVTTPTGLQCAACGASWEGTAPEREQARRADAAWDALTSDLPEASSL
jgi:ribosomal protein L37AE/L43A